MNHPAGQLTPLPPGFTGEGFDAQMHPVQGVGFNSQNVLVDATGAVVRDTSSRPITNQYSGSNSVTAPPSNTTIIGPQYPATPTVGTPPPTAGLSTGTIVAIAIGLGIGWALYKHSQS